VLAGKRGLELTQAADKGKGIHQTPQMEQKSQASRPCCIGSRVGVVDGERHPIGSSSAEQKVERDINEYILRVERS
jgi:hypothetical protein